MSKWVRTTWGEIATLEYGKAVRGYDKKTTGFRVYGTNGPIGWHDVPLCKSAGIVVGRKGAYRGIHYSPEPFFVIDTAFYLKPKIDFDIKWAYYQLLTQDINGMDSGSAIPSTSRDSFYQLPLVLPPIEQQRRIAHILGSLDDKIELNRRLNATLEATARALFRSWFVDFDPVRAKAAGKDAATTCRRLGLTPDVLALFPDALVEGETGEVPVGWEVDSFADAFDLIGGGTPKTSVAEYWNGGIPWFSVVDAPAESDVFVIQTEKTVSVAGVSNSSTRILPEYTTIISARGTVGKVVLTGCEMTMNQSCYAIQGKQAGPFFTYFATKAVAAFLKQISHGTVFDTITRDTFKNAQLVMPKGAAVFQEFEQAVRPLLLSVKANLLESRTLAALRDELLPKLLSGEIELKTDE